MASKLPKYRMADDGFELEVSLATATVNDEPSRTLQAGGEDADINTIVRRFGLDYRMPASVPLSAYGDFSEVHDYQSALHGVMEAQERFDALPAAVRSRFDNDPGQLWSFLNNPSNIEEAAKLGLVTLTEPEASREVSPEAVRYRSAKKAEKEVKEAVTPPVST